MKIRDMTDADLDECSDLSVKVREDSWDKVEHGFYPRELFDQEVALYSSAVLGNYIGRRDRFALVVEDRGRVIGLAIGKCESDTGVADLGWIGVSPARQRKGVAGKLIEAACAKSAEADCHKIIAYTFPGLDGATRMYGRYGFAKEADMKRHWLKLDFVMFSRLIP